MLGPLTVPPLSLTATPVFLSLAEAPLDRSAAAVEACRWGVVNDVSSSSSGAQRTQGVPQA
jgi:hypothetical protein